MANMPYQVPFVIQLNGKSPNLKAIAYIPLEIVLYQLPECLRGGEKLWNMLFYRQIIHLHGNPPNLCINVYMSIYMFVAGYINCHTLTVCTRHYTLLSTVLFAHAH
jgi:hypothetical protein